LKIFLGAFGDPGHAFPMLALGSALVERGHEVAVQTWRRWEDDAVAAGMTFAAAPEYQVFPTRDRPLQPYEAAVHAARATVPSVRDHAPDIAVLCRGIERSMAELLEASEPPAAATAEPERDTEPAPAAD